ncbi:hypothetical protein HOP52_15890 [Halomonas campisalis]|uniref:Cell division protein ZipA n=1 Tax=Billgrantia campisalis TaxID=74661 RepID=A0ABS9PBS9_9GAMM|nr:hypothetical protein [Halomonas campisalis]MCG6659240.1 hypothetical protein [Halomonas campisalis]MDR5864239.1 hypothetical protein [Halomonas campisalis]
MDPVYLALGLAGAALLLALVCAVLYIKVRRPAAPLDAQVSHDPDESSQPEANSDDSAEDGRSVSTAATPQAGSETTYRRFQVTDGTDVQQCLFVVFDWPAKDTNRRLTKRLEAYGARYDSGLQVYVIRDTQVGYKLTVANASPPGDMPPLHEEGEHPIVNGISILVHFINKRRVAHSPDTLIDFTLSVAEIGGQILDADRQAVTEEDFERLRRASA